jgi:hypothetical protein
MTHWRTGCINGLLPVLEMGLYTIPELLFPLNFILLLVNAYYRLLIYLYPFFWQYILVSLLTTIPALLNFHFGHCLLLTDWETNKVTFVAELKSFHNANKKTHQWVSSRASSIHLSTSQDIPGKSVFMLFVVSRVALFTHVSSPTF